MSSVYDDQSSNAEVLAVTREYKTCDEDLEDSAEIVDSIPSNKTLPSRVCL